MAQDFAIGRAGLATSAGGDGLELHLLAEGGWSSKGDECKASGVIRGQSSVNDVNALRQQLSGYDLNTDEPVVPVTWVQDPSIDGFYRVQSVEVSAEVTGRQKSTADGAELAFRWEAELLKVSGWQAPLFELICAGSVRSNAHSIVVTDTYPTVADQVGAIAVDGMTFTPGTSVGSITGADGTLRYAAGGATSDFGITPSWSSDPGDFYKGSCRIEVSYDSGTSWRTVVGRQIPTLPTYWRISNSFVRVTATTTAGTTELSVEHHDGSQWETAKVYVITSDTSLTPTTVAPTALAAFRNGPDTVTLRVIGGSTVRHFLDLTLRRGQRLVEGLWTSNNAATYGIKRATNEAAAALSTTCGLRANATDASGNKYVIATPKALSGSDTTKGGFYVASTTSFPFMIGSAIGGTVGTGIGETMGVALAYMAAIRHTQAVVSF